MACPDEERLAALVDRRLSPKLRQEVEDHAATCESCAQALAVFVELYVPGNHTTSAGPPNRRVALARGTTIGRFLVVEEVGRGAMGVVYAAYDPQLDRKVAIKVSSSALELTGGELEARLRREAQSMARLVHPNVVTVLDFGVEDRGQAPWLFVAMEYVAGSTLRTWLAERPRTVAETLDAFLAAGRGLAAAHEAKIVHRDFKPDNVLIDRNGHVRVTDFGLARAFAAEPTTSVEASGLGSGRESDDLTADDTVVGTPIYMAPEQADGTMVGPAADQFAWCVALYEALYGCLPFPQRTLAERSAAVARGEIATPAVRRDVPVRVHRALLTGLRVDPRERHESMEALVGSIEAGRRRRSSRALVLLGVAGALAVALNHASREGPAHCPDPEAELMGVWDREVRDRLHRHASAELSEEPTTISSLQTGLDERAATWHHAMTELCVDQASGQHTTAVIAVRADCLRQRHAELRVFIEGLLEGGAEVLRFGGVGLRALPEVERCADVSEYLVESERLVDPKLRPRVDEARERVASARAMRASGRPLLAREVIDETVAGLRELGYLPALAEALLEHGLVASAMGRETDARNALSEAVSLAIAQRRHRVAADALMAMLSLRSADASAEETTLLADMALGHIEAAGGGDGERREVLLRRGYAERMAGHYEGAERDWAEAAALGSTRHDTRIDQANEAVLAADAGEWPAAEVAFERWVELAESSPENLAVKATFSTNLGLSRCAMGDPEGARMRFTSALDDYRTLYGAHHPQIAVIHRSLCSCLFEHGYVDEALEQLEHAALVHAEIEAPARDALHLESLRAVAAAHRGSIEDAEEQLERVVERVSERWGSSTPLIAAFELAFGHALIWRQAPRQALPYLERAHRAYAVIFGAQRPLTAKAQALYGIALTRAGDLARGHGQIDEALGRLGPALAFPHVADLALETRSRLREPATGPNARPADAVAAGHAEPL